MIQERICEAYNFIKENAKEIALGALAIPALILMVNALDEKIDIQQKALEAWQQATKTTQVVEASEPEEDPIGEEGVIFDARFLEEIKGESPLLITEREEQEDQALLILEPATDQTTMEEAIETIEESGGDIVHVFPPHILIGFLPKGEEANLVGQTGIVSIYRDLVDASVVADYGQLAQQAVKVWNTSFVNPQPEPTDLSAQGMERPLINDAFEPPDLPPKEVLAASARLAGYYETSEYMIGSVAVGIILPESDGSIDPNTEDWTPEERQLVSNEIVAAMNWWAVREPRANLTFYYDDHFTTPVSISYEPINRSISDTDLALWIGQVMGQLGYSDPSYFTRVRDYVNNIRSTYGTDWAFAIFVVDSSHDSDGCFAVADPRDTPRFAFAATGGPFMVMTYDNDGYDSPNMDAVTAHEMGHIFRALDQYYSAHVPCTARSGWPQVENQNSQYNPAGGKCALDDTSIMRGMIYPYTVGAVDPYARYQVGWPDLDGDDILDPVDQKVWGTLLYPHIPNPTTNDPIEYHGLAVAKPAAVASVEYRLDSGPWLPGAVAIDGAFDEVFEPFTLAIIGVERGSHFVEVRVTDANGVSQTERFGSHKLIVLRPSQYLPIIVKNH